MVAIIPTLGTDGPRLERCLRALVAQGSPRRLAVVVVLNTPEAVDLDPWSASVATILRPGLNLGWAGGLQMGRSAASSATRLWLVQDDMAPDPGCLEALEDALDDDPGLAIVSPLVVDESGLVPPASCGGVLRREPALEIDHWYPATPTAIEDLTGLDALDYVPSRGMLVDLAVWDAVGGMFPGYYPVVWADVDLCTAVVARAGRRFAIAPRARTAHLGQGSTPSPFGAFLFARHRELYRTRWGSAAVPAPARRDPLPDGLGDSVAIAAASLASALAVAYTRLHREAERASALDEEIRDLRASRSWRITAPLRALKGLARRR